jgi:hypothetical protein
MPQKFSWRKGIVILLWILAAASIPIHNLAEAPAWDVAIYMNGVRSVQAGHDPYADAIAIQRKFHAERAKHPNAQVPFSYVYSPITLPVLRLVGKLPLLLSAVVYGGLYLFGLLAQIWVGFRAGEQDERRILYFLAPVAAFFPGFLASDIVWSGNVAFILYGFILLAAYRGWKQDRWGWFYAAVLLASCVKAPLLTLVVIPVFSARKQWLATAVTAAAGCALFLLQPFLWPSLFKNYLDAVNLQFEFNRDFGISPAGLLSGVLYDHGLPFSTVSAGFYLAYAIPILGLLFLLSRAYIDGRITLERWMPTLLLGVILLNPRILEYDEILLALPMFLILWRFFAARTPTPRITMLCTGFVFAVANVIAFRSWSVWKLTEGPLLVLFFLVSAHQLYKQSRLAAGTEDWPTAPTDLDSELTVPAGRF